MKRYKVIAGAVGGRSNKIFQSQDIVTESNFPPGNAAKLVEKGFLEFLDDVEDTQDAIDPTGYEELETDVSGPDETKPDEGAPDHKTEDSNSDEQTPPSDSDPLEGDTSNTTKDQSLIAKILNGGLETQDEPNEGKTDEATTDEVSNASETDTDEEGGDSSDETQGGFKMKDITVKELKAELEKMGIPFDANASKKELFDLWVKKVI
jgi:hypothetical protein